MNTEPDIATVGHQRFINSKANFYLAFGPHRAMNIDTISKWIQLLVLESSGYVKLQAASKMRQQYRQP